jgi:sulfur-carrier protein adenylyltransferase/sulfurtransferase
MSGFRELLANTKKKIREVDPADAETRLDDATFLDVRELDEYEQGTVPDSVFIPRGHLENLCLPHATLADGSTTDH